MIHIWALPALGGTCLLRSSTPSPLTFPSSGARSPLLQQVLRLSSASRRAFPDSSRVWLVLLALSSSNMEALFSLSISSRSSKVGQQPAGAIRRERKGAGSEPERGFTLCVGALGTTEAVVNSVQQVLGLPAKFADVVVEGRRVGQAPVLVEGVVGVPGERRAITPLGRAGPSEASGRRTNLMAS